MRILITDVTRMSIGKCCIAGVDIETGARIRPVLPGGDQLERGLLAPNGPFHLGAVVELGPVEQVGAVPMIEDHQFTPAVPYKTASLTPDEYWESLTVRASSWLPDIFGSDFGQPRGRNAAVREGSGKASLGFFAPTEPPRLETPWERPILHIATDDLQIAAPVNDLRFYDDDNEPLREIVEEIAAILEGDGQCVLSVGLARAHRAQGDTRPRHWFQVNGIHLADDPLWGVNAN